MPDLDFALLCDYVRAESGVAHVIAGGVDTVFASEVPTTHQVGILLRLRFTRNECGRAHWVEVVFQDTDGESLTHITGSLTPEPSADLPPGWRTGAIMGLNVTVTLPSYGLYTFEVLVNDSSVKSLDFRVVPAPQDPAGPAPGPVS